MVSAVVLALSVMLKVAVSAAVVLGVKVIEAEQLVEVARVDVQVVDETAKSAALVPVIDGAVRVTELPVLLVTVMVCEELVDPSVTLPKLKLLGAEVTFPVPRPDRETS